MQAYAEGWRLPMQDHLTIEQAAQALGVSKDTVRRRIKTGELQAVKRKENRGEVWMIEAGQINAATVTIDALPMTRDINPGALIEAIAAKIGTQQGEIKSELATIRIVMDELLKERAEDRQLLAEALAELRAARDERRPWWRRWL